MAQQRPTALEWQQTLAEATPIPDAVSPPATAVDEAAIATIVQQQLHEAAANASRVDEAAIAAVVQQQMGNVTPAGRPPMFDLLGKWPRLVIATLWVLAVIIPLSSLGISIPLTVATVQSEGATQTNRVRHEGETQMNSIVTAGYQATQAINTAKRQADAAASDHAAAVRAQKETAQAELPNQR